jgi:hypothetical protein
MQQQQLAVPAPVIRTVVLTGEDLDPDRRGTKKIVARSECRFRCDDDETLNRCIEQLRASDEHLRSRPAEMMLWDWQHTTMEKSAFGDQPGGVIVLGVAWYDLEFFTDRKDAYTNPSHLAKYLDIGLAPGAIEVSHWRAEGGGTA